MRGTNTLAHETAAPLAKDVCVSEDVLTVSLDDGRSLSVPLVWYPRLLQSTLRERRQWRLVGRGEGIYWPKIEEDISIAGLLAGHPSRESRESFAKWLASKPPSLQKRRTGSG
jgi:hypothetical protein